MPVSPLAKPWARLDLAHPAKAGAHFGDVVVVAHEEFVVVDIVDVVGVHDAVLVGAGKGETVVGGANVGATWVKSAKTLLSECGALNTVAVGVLGDVTGTFLTGTEETGTSGLASAGLGAGAPCRPLGNFAVFGAGLLVARSGLGEAHACFAAVCGGSGDAAVLGHCATTTSLGAYSIAVQVACYAIDGAGLFNAGHSVI